MDVYANSSGLQNIVGYGSHSVVVSHHPNNYYHYHPVSTQPLTKSTSAYQLVPFIPVERTAILVPVQQQKQKQQPRQTRPAQVTQDPFRAEQYVPSRGASAQIPRYNSLDDPHMQDYYARKFGTRSKSATRHSARTEALYRITVKTADKKDAGTNAKVYLSIHGSKGKLCRKLLTRETMLRGHSQLSASLNGLNKISDNDIYNIEFKRGATDIVYIRHRDLGVISSIVLEHAGLLMEQSWLCEYIMITNVRNGHGWFFPCNQWLSLYPPGDSLAIELFPGDRGLQEKRKRRASAPETTEFEINVVTGNQRSAGTDSQVYVTLFGEDGQRTAKLHLKKSLNNKNPFERNQTDTFRVKGDYVGELVKLRIEHDNTGRLAGWFLDRVVVTDLYDSKTKYFANCNKWLAKDEGDGQIARDLVLHKNKAGGRDSNQYKIIVYTGNKRGAGTDADVSITLFGEFGESGAILLDDKKNNFESGQKDEFKIECPSVGEINKILIGHNNKGTGPGWFLDRILVEDLNEHRIYEFPCNRWLATDEDDGQISRFLFPKKGGSSTPMPTDDEGIPYNITVYTGNKSNAGTDARIYVIMHNKKSTSGQIFLPGGKFEKSSVDLCAIQAPDELSPLTALDIGHDNSGRGPGWFLDKVVVDCPSTGIKQTFPCNRWLAADEDDHKIERRLKEDLSLREQRPPTTPWYIWVYTSDLRGAGTDAEVKLVLYGHDGKSDDIKLKSKSDTFEAGKCDEFKVDVTEVGKPYKLRVSHDNAKAFAAWHLDRIEMENLKTNKRYIFRCGKWLQKGKGDSIVRELPAEGPEIKRPLPVTNYAVDVYTGDKRGAGTDANVFINIFGDCGDTGERPLEETKNANKFERNQMDSFAIEAVSLKNIQKIRIGHDGRGIGAGWFLAKVVVRPADERYPPATFECNRWLATDEDDGKIVRELTLNTATQHLDKTTYNVQIKTGDVFGAGTDADVHLKIFGSKGDSDKILLRQSDNTKNKFERNQIDKFTYEFDDLGKIKSILIGHNGKRPGAGWFLDWVEIDIPMRGEAYRFACHRWLDKNEDDGQIELNLTPSDVTRKQSVIPYEVTVFTGDKSGAGTDAKVFIQMYGLNGKTEEIVLKNKSDTFEQKAVDKFKLEAPDIGEIQKIRIGHNSSGFGSAWYLEKVLVQRHLNEPQDRRKKSFKNVGSHRLSQISATDPNVEEYWFVCRQWFDKSSGDRQTVRELMPTDADGNILSSEKEVSYNVHVFTGRKRGAGTDANVFLTIYGQHTDSGERQLKNSNHKNKFEDGQEDIFEVKAVSLGKLRKIKIRHDNSGIGAAWFLDRVEIVDPETEKVYHFVCQKWLATNEDDGMISREIPALENKALRLASARESVSGSSMDYNLEMKALATTYKVNVFTSDKFGTGTNANVYITIFGDLNDTGIVPLMTSKTHKDPFESGHQDVFEIESMDIGEPKKIKIGHDNSGLRPDWLLERVVIDVPKMGRSWVFPCGKWLSKSKGNHELEVELYPQEKATEIYQPHIPYEIKIYTSKLSNAGTDANVFIEIYGEEKTTGQVTLCSKTERKGKFQTGSTDVFVPELEDVGEEITKIRIGHDNSGFGAAWHLDRVEIRRLLDNQKTSTYVFPCNRWFAKNEDDRQIIRELVPDKVIEEKLTRDGQLRVKEKDVRDRLDMKQYVVDVYTADKFGAGTDANVYCTIFGDKGDTGERELSKSETHTNKFERKQMDRFKIECANLGDIYKLKIRHDNSGVMNADWLLERVEVVDDIKTYVFHCEQWLSKSKGDKKIERTLYEKDYQGSMSSVGSVPRSIGGSKASLTSVDSKNEPFRAGQRKNLMTSIAEDEEARDQTGDTIPYTIRITTGQASDAGTSANAYIRLFGQKGQKTNLIPLKLMQRRRFEPGNVDTFSIQARDIGELDVVEIEHDGQTDDDSWYIDGIRIEMPTNGRAYYFDCHQWLAKNKSDGRTKRRLQVQSGNQSSYRPLIPYEVTIYTGDVEHAGCDCDVGLKLFGVNGSSSEHIIRKDEGNFERGKIDRFQIELDDVGKPLKIRARIIPKGKKARSKWFLENIELIKQTRANERPRSYFFGLMDWISAETDYHRDLPISKDGQALIKETTYRIVTKTSDIDGAGCDSNVFVTLFGETGDSGELELKHSSKHRNKFERNHDDEFLFENILSLGELTKLRIRHDDSAFMKSSWHLEYVLVEDTQTGQHYKFPCNKWLSSKKDDKQIVRELVCDENSSNTSRRGSTTPGGRVSYEIEVTTSDKRDAGTTQNGWVILIGKKKRSEKFYFKNTPQKKILRNGKTDRFTFESRSLGELTQIIVGHEERRDHPLPSYEDRQAFWHVSQINVTDASTGTMYEFPIRKWIEINNRGDEFDCQNKEEDRVSKQRHRRTINYKIIVHTGDVAEAGTDANVSIILYGTLGDTGKRPLKQKGRNLFERRQVDEFVIECLDLGQLEKLHIEHDNSGFFNADWFLDKVEVINMETDEKILFPCNEWLGVKHGDHEIQRDLLPIYAS